MLLKQQMTDLVSIIIPSYNYSKYIGDCLLSCVHQTHENIEIIIVDDASKDKSVELIYEYKRMDDRICLHNHYENKGYSAAKNAGIKIARGDYIVHLDADDMLTPDSVEVRLRAINEESYKRHEMVHGKAYVFNGDKSYSWCLRKQMMEKLPVDRSVVHAQGIMVRKDVYKKYGLYYEGLRSKADKEMVYRLRDIAGINIGALNIPVAFYRKHSNSMLAMRGRSPAYEKKIQKIFKRRMDDLKKNGITCENTPSLQG